MNNKLSSLSRLFSKLCQDWKNRNRKRANPAALNAILIYSFFLSFFSKFDVVSKWLLSAAVTDRGKSEYLHGPTPSQITTEDHTLLKQTGFMDIIVRTDDRERATINSLEWEGPQWAIDDCCNRSELWLFQTDISGCWHRCPYDLEFLTSLALHSW